MGEQFQVGRSTLYRNFTQQDATMAPRQDNAILGAATRMFVVEAILIAALFWADIHHWHHVVVFSKTSYLFLLGWLSLRLRGIRWRSIGMCRPTSWPQVLTLGILAGCAVETLELFVTQPLLIRCFHQAPDLSDVACLRGHVRMLALALLPTWTLAAFGEETVRRCYFLNRLAGVLGQTRARWAISVVLSSVVFGFAHYDQGRTGIVENVIDRALLCGHYPLP